MDNGVIWFAKPMPDGQKYRFGVDTSSQQLIAANPLPPQTLRSKMKKRRISKYAKG